MRPTAKLSTAQIYFPDWARASAVSRASNLQATPAQ
jgi:hypothetical protein